MSKEYNKYLEEHKANVAKGYYWLVDNLPEVVGGGVLERQICVAHDQSKSDEDEYYAYDEYFYGNDQSYYVKQAFNLAWLKHIHKNPHHWQYWVLNNDEPNEGEVILDMDLNYIIEMICDWWAFSWKDGKLFEIFDWYNQHKTWIKLSDKTKYTLEDILKKMYDKLTENGGI
jgi:hypothetical protein